MRIVFLTRVLPIASGSPLERRFARRLTELTDLGHDVLVLSRWQVELPELQLGKRVEIRYPFRRFGAWEWPQALPLLLSWRPDLIHIVDPGLGARQRLLGAEASTFPVIETLKRGFRRLAVPRILVSTLSDDADTWANIGARHVESRWLSLQPSQAPVIKRSHSKRVRVFVAGKETERPGHFENIRRILTALSRSMDLEVGCILDRSALSRTELQSLLRWERQAGESASRLLLIPQAFLNEALSSPDWDCGIVAGLSSDALRRWQESLSMPLVISECQLEWIGRDPRVMKAVSEIAWLEQSLTTSQDASLREAVWTALEEGAHHLFQDDATNWISRLYAVALAENASPS